MLAAILRLLALRPLLTLSLFGIPILILIVVGLFTIAILKFLIFIVLPIVLIVWLVRRFLGSDNGDESAGAA